MKARTRFLIVAVFKDGAYVKIESRKDRAIPLPQLVADLREYADAIERGIAAEAKAEGATT